MQTTHLIGAAARSNARARSSSITVTLVLALGLGLSLAVYTVADALLLRRLPVAEQQQLVALHGEMRDHSLDNVPLSIANAREFAAATQTLRDVAFFEYEGSWLAPVGVDQHFTRLQLALVSGNYFDVLGAAPVLGRPLHPADDVAGAAPVVVISYDTWGTMFGDDRNVIGQTLTLEQTGISYRIVGVMPAGLRYPNRADVWIPIVPITTTNGASNAQVDLVGRLAPKATIAEAASEWSAFFARTRPSAGAASVHGVARSLPDAILGDTRPAVLTFAAAAALLLLIACLNVANLVLVRGLSRFREMAVRSALGASRRFLLTQLLIENGMLAVAGGALGVGFAVLAVKVLITLAPSDIPLLNTVRLEPRLLGGAIALTAVATMIFGIAPALLTSRTDAAGVLRSGTRQTASRHSRIARELLVAAQVALAALILAAAAIVGRSLLNLENADLNFDESRLLIAELGVRYDKYDDAAKQLALIDAVLAEVRAVPGVRSVSPVLTAPFSGASGWDAQAPTEGQTATDAARNPVFNLELVTPDYFETLGITATRGRLLMRSDRKGTESVMVVSQSMARRYWPGKDPIGKRLLLGPHLERHATVVGVVDDTRYRDLRDARPTVYFPLAQSMFPFTPTALAIRSNASPASIIPDLRRAIAAAAPGVSLVNAAPFATFEAGVVAQPRLHAFLLFVFACSAAFLAGIGLFATMATLVRQRAHELGVRMALGATRADVASMVMVRGFTLALGGVGAGLVMASMTNRLLSSLLYDVAATDAATLVGAGGLLVVIGLVATVIPARASARIDPVVAMRTDG
jgi:predicted permease